MGFAKGRDVGHGRRLHVPLRPFLQPAPPPYLPSLMRPPLSIPPPSAPSNSVSSAFSHLLNLHNLSEEISTAMHERAVRVGDVS